MFWMVSQNACLLACIACTNVDSKEEPRQLSAWHKAPGTKAEQGHNGSRSRSHLLSLLFDTLLDLSSSADTYTAKLAMKLNRKLLLEEQRSRLLLAVRQTYNNFFQDHYVTTGQVFHLRVSPTASN